MENSYSDEKLMSQARERVEAKIGFRSHVMVYITVNLCLTVMYFFASRGGYFWPGWSMAGWGIGLLVHGLGVYIKFHGKSHEEEIQREYRRLKERVTVA
jgi:hypothetical protein